MKEKLNVRLRVTSILSTNVNFTHVRRWKLRDTGNRPLRTHLIRWNSKVNFIWETFGFWNNFSKMTSLFIILFMFIHNSSSKNGRKTITSKLLKHRFSAGCVGEFLQFWLSARFSRTNFDTKIVNFVLKLVLRELGLYNLTKVKRALWLVS